MKIAVDFDGTIVEHRFPAIGKPKLFAFETLRELQKRDFKLVLWTYRAGRQLDEAIEYCKMNGITFYAINANHPDEVLTEKISRKIDADIFIDDKNIGGFPGWSRIWEMMELGPLDSEKLNLTKRKQKNWFSNFFRKKKS